MLTSSEVRISDAFSFVPLQRPPSAYAMHFSRPNRFVSDSFAAQVIDDVINVYNGNGNPHIHVDAFGVYTMSKDALGMRLVSPEPVLLYDSRTIGKLSANTPLIVSVRGSTKKKTEKKNSEKENFARIREIPFFPRSYQCFDDLSLCLPFLSPKKSYLQLRFFFFPLPFINSQGSIGASSINHSNRIWSAGGSARCDFCFSLSEHRKWYGNQKEKKIHMRRRTFVKEKNSKKREVQT